MNCLPLYDGPEATAINLEINEEVLQHCFHFCQPKLQLKYHTSSTEQRRYAAFGMVLMEHVGNIGELLNPCHVTQELYERHGMKGMNCFFSQSES